MGDSDTLVRYGELCLRRGDEAEARRAFRMGASPPGLVRMGTVPGLLERLRAQAQAATTRAFRRLAARPDATTEELAAGAHLVAGRGAAAGGSRREATAAHCRRAVELTPRSALARCLLAVTLDALGDRKASGVELAQARRLARGPEKADVERWATVLRLRQRAGGPAAP